MNETSRSDGASMDVMRALMVLSDMEWSVAQSAGGENPEFKSTA